MAKRMLADVLWEAANVYLLPKYNQTLDDRDSFSCNAVELALYGGCRGSLRTSHPVREFLRSLGCTGSAVALSAVSGLRHYSHELQGARYMWLLLAMKVAEDEGIELEPPHA